MAVPSINGSGRVPWWQLIRVKEMGLQLSSLFIFLICRCRRQGKGLSLLLGPCSWAEVTHTLLSPVSWGPRPLGAGVHSGGVGDWGRLGDGASPHCSGLCLNLALKTHPFRVLPRPPPTLHPPILHPGPACAQVEYTGPPGMTHL